MTRYLSLALGAEEPVFSQSIQQLERASGSPSADIRLTATMQQRTREKLSQLGLDPNDTTGPELYRALHEQLRQDEVRLRNVLKIQVDSTLDEVLTSVVELVNSAQLPKRSFTIRQSVAKRMFKKKQPKLLMKKLGYRSVDSMLKHEPVAHLYAAAAMVESKKWLRQFYDQYTTLTPSDFEMRDMVITLPQSKKWKAISDEFAATHRHTVLTFKEIGVIVVLPSAQAVDGLAITTTLLTLHAMNEVRSFSSYIKLQQVRPDFGDHLKEIIADEPKLSATVAGRIVPWRTLHRYYATSKQGHPNVFEPHVQEEDVAWFQPEDILAKLNPALGFWVGTQDLVLLHEGQPVSYNMLDVALGCYNNLPFKDRVVHFVRDAIWHEVMQKYISPLHFEAVLNNQLSYTLAEDLPLADS